LDALTVGLGDICVGERTQSIPATVLKVNHDAYLAIARYEAANHLQTSPWRHYKLVNTQTFPFDKSQIKAIEKAIRESGLGFDPAVQGAIVRVPLPYGSPRAPACVIVERTFAAVTGPENAGTVTCSLKRWSPTEYRQVSTPRSGSMSYPSYRNGVLTPRPVSSLTCPPWA